MKRAVSAILTVLIVIVLFGCAKGSNDYEAPVVFYYRPTSEAHKSTPPVFATEIRETANLSGDSLSVLNLYLNGPISEKCLSPFPAGVTAESITFDGTVVTVTMSNAFASLTGINLTIACAGIYQTMTPVWNCGEVLIQCNSMQLDGQNTISINHDSLIFTDISQVSAAE